MLRYLIDQRGKLVGRREIVQAVWRETKISDVVLRGCLREIRQALGDVVQAPKFIETIPHRGWRFIASPEPVFLQYPTDRQPEGLTTLPPLRSSLLPGTLISRESDLEQLQQHLETARHDSRQVVFIKGEMGIGKTALLDAFVKQTTALPDVWIARGQCVNQHEANEPYFPVLDALDQLCRGLVRQQLLPLLRRQAPLWLLQMPGVLTPEEKAHLRKSLGEATPERMLREMAALINAITVDHSLFLVLEDLQWSDASTLSLLAFLARCRKTARLLIVGTYRLAEGERPKHLLRDTIQELAQSRHCREIELRSLSEREIAELLARKFPEGIFPPAVSAAVYRRTEGNPLFVTHLVEHLVNQGWLVLHHGQWKMTENLQQHEHTTWRESGVRWRNKIERCTDE